MKKISEFLSENFEFLVLKFSIYLNRRVFIMVKENTCKDLQRLTSFPFSFNCFRRTVASFHGPYLELSFGATKMTAVQLELIQSTLVISNSKGLSEILRDIRTLTYQICRIK